GRDQRERRAGVDEDGQVLLVDCAQLDALIDVPHGGHVARTAPDVTGAPRSSAPGWCVSWPDHHRLTHRSRYAAASMPYSASFSWRCWRYMPMSSAAFEMLPWWRASASWMNWRSKRSTACCFASRKEPGGSAAPSDDRSRTEAGRSPSAISGSDASATACS